MYRIKLPSGEESSFGSFEEFSFGVVSGIIDAEAEIYHSRAEKWLPIKVHPDFKRAVGDAAVPPPANAEHPGTPSTNGVSLEETPTAEEAEAGGLDLLTLLDLEELTAFDPGKVQESAPAQDPAVPSETHAGATSPTSSSETNGRPEPEAAEDEDEARDAVGEDVPAPKAMAVVEEDEQPAAAVEESPEIEPEAVEDLEVAPADEAFTQPEATAEVLEDLASSSLEDEVAEADAGSPEDLDAIAAEDASSESDADALTISSDTELEAQADLTAGVDGELSDMVELVAEAPTDLDVIDDLEVEESADTWTDENDDDDPTLESEPEEVKDYVKAEWDADDDEDIAAFHRSPGDDDATWHTDDAGDDASEEHEAVDVTDVMDDEADDTEGEAWQPDRGGDETADAHEVVGIASEAMDDDAEEDEAVGVGFAEPVDSGVDVESVPAFDHAGPELVSPAWGDEVHDVTMPRRRVPFVPIAAAVGLVLMAVLGWMVMGSGSPAESVTDTSPAPAVPTEAPPELAQESLGAADPSPERRDGYEAAYRRAQADLDAGLRSAGFRRLFASSRFSSTTELNQARAAIAAAGTAFKAYGARQASIESDLPGADPSLAEPRVNRELAEDLLAVSDRIFLTVRNNAETVSIRNGMATITDARVEAEYVRLVAEFERLLVLAGSVDDGTPAPTLARVVDAIGTTRPPPLPELAPAPEIPNL